MEPRCHKIFAPALLAMLCGLAFTACSSGADNRGDIPMRGASSQVAMGSADQCLENGASVESAGQDAGGYRIQPGDQLAIDFYLNSEFNDNVSVQPDGRIVLRLVGPLSAGGLTPGPLSAEINKAYS